MCAWLNYKHFPRNALHLFNNKLLRNDLIEMTFEVESGTE